MRQPDGRTTVPSGRGPGARRGAGRPVPGPGGGAGAAGLGHRPVKTGRLQVGPWYVLADELIPSGESLIRNLLLGAADAERLGGRLDVLYSPDAFGHPAAWPELAREFGIRYGVLWRGRGGEPGEERDLFRWAGAAGREVLVWHLPPQGYEIGAALPAARERLSEAWPRVRDALLGRAQGKHVPVFIGADHHAAHPDLSHLRDQLAALEPENAVRISRLDEFFQAAAAEPGGAGGGGGERVGRGPRSRSTRVSSGGPTATPGRCKACTARGCRSSGGTPCWSCGSSDTRSRSPPWRVGTASAGATDGLCSSSPGGRWSDANSMMRSEERRATRWPRRSRLGSSTSRRTRARSCEARCRSSWGTIPTWRGNAPRQRGVGAGGGGKEEAGSRCGTPRHGRGAAW